MESAKPPDGGSDCGKCALRSPAPTGKHQDALCRFGKLTACPKRGDSSSSPAVSLATDGRFLLPQEIPLIGDADSTFERRIPQIAGQMRKIEDEYRDAYSISAARL